MQDPPKLLHESDVREIWLLYWMTPTNLLVRASKSPNLLINIPQIIHYNPLNHATSYTDVCQPGFIVAIAYLLNRQPKLCHSH